jgi:type I restriction-modification system DNA methylase subunit
MATAQQIQRALEKIHDRASFLQQFLAETLDWPIDRGVEDPEEISYGWNEEELRTQGLDKHLVEAQARQFRPFRPGQPWGIFLLEFRSPVHFDTAHRLTSATGTLRRVLRGLVPSRRHDSALAAWQREHLLFLCTHDYKQFRFAYFKAPLEPKLAAPLAAFGWNQGETHVRTLCEFNLPALAWPEDDGHSEETWLKQWSRAFDVEAVTKRFFAEYRAVFEKVEDAVKGVPKGEPRRLYVQRLLNRLMFLYFIQRKGWLAFQGDKRYLRALFNAASAAKEDFLNDRLYWTFFYGLNNGAEDYSVHSSAELKERRGEVPFLNGGLFDLEDKYDVREEVKIPNDAFAAVFDLFDRYNFTVTESTPLDIEVAVDPEMLGKVFEELVTGRHETGSYYTPRPIVAFMCREALKHYLHSIGARRASKGGSEPPLLARRAHDVDADESAIARFVDDGDPTELPDPEAVLNALRSVKICDPACGSGAYLLGMMQELLRLREALFATRGLDDVTVYRRKLEIIQNNLYGVDIDLFAVNIAKLRLWLSLAVDFQGAKPPPLPNLDFKIECGDSLTAPNPQEMPDLFRRLLVEKADQLADLKAQFLQVYGDAKKKLVKRVKAEEAELGQSIQEHIPEGSVDWRVAFAEIFKNGGFDIALANPPYVRQELITDLKPILKQNFDYAYQGTADLYIYFYARGIELLRDGGVLAYIAPNKFFRAGYGKKLRSYLTRDTQLRALLDFADFPIFESITYPAVLILQNKKARRGETHSLIETYNWRPSDDVLSVSRVFHEKSAHLSQDHLSAEGWAINDNRTNKTLEKLRSVGQSLGHFVEGRLFYGIKTGCNEAFEIDEALKDELCKKDPKSAEIIRPWLRGRNIERWKVDWQGKYLILTRRGIDINRYRAVKKHLEHYREMLEPRPANVAPNGWLGRKPGTYKWYEIQDAIDYWQEFDRPKIVYQVIATYQQFAFTVQPYVTNDKAWIIPDPASGLLAILNSKVAWFFLDQVAAKLQGGAFELRSPFMSQIPIVPPSKELIAKEKAMLVLAGRGDAKSDEGKALEKDIDEIVTRLYGLAREEVQVIDEALALCGNRFPFKETDEYKAFMRATYGEE